MAGVDTGSCGVGAQESREHLKVSTSGKDEQTGTTQPQGQPAETDWSWKIGAEEKKILDFC